MNIILFDTLHNRIALKPFSFTKPLAKIRIGIATIEEKWQHYLKGDYSFLTANYLNKKFPIQAAGENVLIKSTVCPNAALANAIKRLKPQEQLVKGNTLIALVCDQALLKKIEYSGFPSMALKRIEYKECITEIKHKWDIFSYNDQEIRNDVAWLCQDRKSNTINDQHTVTYAPAHIFLEANVTLKAAVLNAEAGPIYIGKNAVIQEGAIIQGPVAIGEGACIKFGAKIQNATTIGPYAVVGGEIQNSVIFGYSNKAHDGFLGHTVIGEWCNIGAGTNTSNLKNNYGKVNVWDYRQDDFVNTHLQFCGTFMGDHSKCGINTMFNAGTVVGVSSNLFGVGFCDKFIPSFTWGPSEGHATTYDLHKALDVAEKVMQRRSQSFTEQDHNILTHIFRDTNIYRFKKSRS